MKQKIQTTRLALEKPKSEYPAGLPYINSIDKVAIGFGSKEEFVEACKISTVPSVMTFVRIAEELPDATLADVCEMAELPPDKLLELVVPALFRWSSSVSKLLVAINQPRTVQVGIESAMIHGVEGAADRKMQYQISGLLGKDGPSVLVNNVLNVGDLESFEDTVVDVTPRNVQPETD